MKIHIVKGSADGPTELAAFDGALQRAGVSDQNLICLSSIIPPNSLIDFDKPDFSDDYFGNKLYCVLAQKRETIAHRQAWAGIGWVTDKATGKGLFVEHEGHSEDEVQQDIHKSLTDMVARRNDTKWSDIQMVVEGIVCGDKPVCALVCAIYQSEGWG